MSITTARSGLFVTLLLAASFVLLPFAAKADSANLIANPGFETHTGNNATGWETSVYPATSTPSFAISTAAFRSGAASAQVTYSTPVTNVEARWIFTPNIAATSTLQYYTFSDWYKTSATNTSVFVYFSNGSIQWLGDTTALNTWSQFTANFLVQPGLTFTIGHALQSQGTLNTDDYVLTRASQVPTFPQGLVTLSFDDGWDTYYANAYPILASSTMKNTAYVITKANATAGNIYMTDAQIQQIGANSFIEVGSHTRNHLDLVKDTPSAFGYADQAAMLQGEIVQSLNDLKALLPSKTINTFAYPYGSYRNLDGTVNTDVRNLVAANYVGARSVDQGFNLTTTDDYALKQQHITNTTTLAQAKEWIDAAIADKSWLIFMFHDVRPTIETCVDRAHQDVADQDCTDTALLQGIVDYLKTKPGGTVVTTQEGMALKAANMPPVFTTPANVYKEATSTNGVVVTYPTPTVTPAGSVTCSPTSGQIFPVGTTTVACTSGSANTSFSVVVSLHQAPVASNTAVSTNLGSSTNVTLPATGTGTLTYTVVTNPALGSLSGSGSTRLYTPAATTSAYTTTFTFKVNDGTIDSNVATATITVSLAPVVNSAPVAEAQSVSLDKNTSKAITLTGTDADSGDTKVFATTTNPAHGSLSGSGASLTYTPTTDYVGSDSFNFSVGDGKATSTATVSITVNEVVVTPPSNGGGCSGCGCGGCGGGGGTVVGLIGTVNTNPTGGVVLGASTGLTETQINAIIDLLKSFGADQSVIDNVNKSLHGTGSTSGKYVFTKTLQVGSTGTEVTELQKRLTSEGVYAGPVTGYFGQLTKAGVMKYQAAHGLPSVGVVGPLTRAQLNK